MARRRLFAGYFTVSLVATAPHAFLPTEVRAVSYFLIALAGVPAVWYGLRHQARTRWSPTALLLAALVALSLANLASLIGTFDRPEFGVVAEAFVTIGHILALAGALSIVRLRGRNDVGGVIDVAVVSMALGGVLWTTVMQPHLDELGVTAASQASILVNVLVLTGVLGAVLRLEQTASEPILALRLIITALVMALGANVALVMTTGSITAGRPPAVEVIFLLSFICLGATGLHPSMALLARPGTPPVEQLSPGRLTFLGVAMALGPVVGAGRQVLGLPVDGLLLAAGTIATVPLVMIRIGYLNVQRVRVERQLVRQATHDSLTGLTNRSELHVRLEAALARRAAGGRAQVLVLFCDLDGFKAVNDTLGHAVGDELLVAVARRLAGAVARDDVLARYGGDEFLIVCETADPMAAQTSLRRRVAAALSHPFDLAGQRISIGVSIGAVVAEPNATADEVIGRADTAMYAVKQGRPLQHLRSA